MPNRVNRLMHAEVVARYRDVADLVLVGYRGLNADQVGSFRAELRGQGARMRVVKNRITVRAFSDLERPEVMKLFEGPTAILDGGEDPVALARLACEFAKRNEKLEIKGGVVEGQVLTAGEIKKLAELPGRAELQGQIVGLACGPGGAVASAVTAAAGRLAGAIQALIEGLEGSDSAQGEAA